MQQLSIPLDYPNHFVYQYLPKVITNMLYNKIARYKDSKMNSYLSDNYDMQIVELLPILCDIKIEKYRYGYIMQINTNRSKINSKYSVAEILHLIDYGNIEVKGLHIINNIFEYIRNNLNMLYRLYMFTQKVI